jgi:hypothetical protein
MHRLGWPVAVILLSLTAASATGITNIEATLLQLACNRFSNDVSAAEEKLFRSAASGKIAHYGSRLTHEDGSTNSFQLRIIRSDRLAWLCTHARASELVSYRGVVVDGAYLEGELDLSLAKIPFPLAIVRCVAGEINLNQAQLRVLFLDGNPYDNSRSLGQGTS